VEAYLGTYWRVQDSAAAHFATLVCSELSRNWWWKLLSGNEFQIK
jgi:hypothetical protein